MINNNTLFLTYRDNIEVLCVFLKLIISDFKYGDTSPSLEVNFQCFQFQICTSPLT
jgi:hypothetical protein